MKNKLTTFYLVRHGETDWNKKHIIQGQLDTELNETGVLQAKKLAKEMKQLKFDLAFASDLLRSKRTTEIIALEHKLEIQTTNLLRERHMGSVQGKPSQLLFAYSKLMLAMTQQERLTHKMAPGAESDEEFISRLLTFFRETALAYPGKSILVGTHSGVMRILLIHLGIYSYKDYENLLFKNGGYIVLESDGVEFFIKEIIGIKSRKKGSTEV